MGIKHRLNRLEQEAAGYFDIIILPDGQEVRYTPADFLAALGAAARGGEHWLIDAAVRAEVRGGPVGLLWALSASHERLRAHKAEEERD